MPIVNVPMFQEGDLLETSNFTNILESITGSVDSPGVYGGDGTHGVDHENIRDGAIQTKNLMYHAEKPESVFSNRLQKVRTTNVSTPIYLARNSTTAWRYVTGSTIAGSSDSTKASLSIPWHVEDDQYVIIRCSAVLDSATRMNTMPTGFDAWDLGLYIVPPGQDEKPLPEITQAFNANDAHSAVVWPWQRMCLNDAYSRDFYTVEELTKGLEGEIKGNDFLRGKFSRKSYMNQSFMLQYAARSGSSATQAGVCPSATGVSKPPVWNRNGTAKVYLVYRNLQPLMPAETGDARTEVVDLLESASSGYGSMPLLGLRMHYTVYRR